MSKFYKEVPMKLKAEHKKALLEEFDYASRAMREAQTAEEKLFYFSSTYGVVSRVFNFECEPQLVFMHLVLNSAYGTILTRLQAMKAGDQTILMRDDFFEKLTKALEELTQRIKTNTDIYDVLERIVMLSYITTGNGYYLLKRGLARID
jgi:hypothetical protein